MSSTAVWCFAIVLIEFRDRISRLTHNVVDDALFFSPRCSKPNAVLVDPRPHYMRHPRCYIARRAAMAKRKKKAVKTAKKTKKKKKKI
jgi:hypothetical protein